MALVPHPGIGGLMGMAAHPGFAAQGGPANLMSRLQGNPRIASYLQQNPNVMQWLQSRPMGGDPTAMMNWIGQNPFLQGANFGQGQAPFSQGFNFPQGTGVNFAPVQQALATAGANLPAGVRGLFGGTPGNFLQGLNIPNTMFPTNTG